MSELANEETSEARKVSHTAFTVRVALLPGPSALKHTPQVCLRWSDSTHRHTHTKYYELIFITR